MTTTMYKYTDSYRTTGHHHDPRPVRVLEHLRGKSQKQTDGCVEQTCRYLSKATCLIRPRLFCMFLVLSRTVVICKVICN